MLFQTTIAINPKVTAKMPAGLFRFGLNRNSLRGHVEGNDSRTAP